MAKVYLYAPRYTEETQRQREVDETTAKLAAADESELWRQRLRGLHGEGGHKRASHLGLSGIVLEYEDTEEHDHFARHWRDLCTGLSGVDRMSIADRWEGPGRVRGRSNGLIQNLLTDGETVALKADKLAEGAALAMREALDRQRQATDARLGCFRSAAQRPKCLSGLNGPCYYCPCRKV